MAFPLCSAKPLSDAVYNFSEICNKVQAIAIKEDELENAACKMAAILFQPNYSYIWHYGNSLRPSDAYMRQYTNHRWCR